MAASRLLSNPAFRPLAERFVEALPDRVGAIRQAIDEDRREEATRLAHQLKGAGGGYGFTSISSAAAAVEGALESDAQVDTVVAALSRLAKACGDASATLLATAGG